MHASLFPRPPAPPPPGPSLIPSFASVLSAPRPRLLFARLRFACLYAAQLSTTNFKALCAQVGLRCGGVYHVLKHAQHCGVTRRGRGRQLIRRLAKHRSPSQRLPRAPASSNDINIDFDIFARPVSQAGWFRVSHDRYRNHIWYMIPSFRIWLCRLLKTFRSFVSGYS
jgi:hypothetical protein